MKPTLASLKTAEPCPLRFLSGAQGKTSLYLTLLALASLIVPANSTVLIYEGFDGYDSANNNFRTESPNANTVGLGTDTWVSPPTESAGNMTADSTGLTLGSLVVNGGRLSFSGALVASTNLAPTITALTPGSTLYGSYLVNFSAINTGGNNGFTVRLANVDGAPATSGAGAANNAIFQSFPVSRTDGGTEGLAVSYDNSPGGVHQPSSTGNTLSASTNYIILSRYTNVGSTLSVGSPGVAETWALTQSQFEAFVDNDRNESWLGILSNVSAYSTETLTSGTFNLSSSYFLQIVNASQAGSIDEIRFGTHLLDVVPIVPEPSRAFLLSLALTGCLLRRRR